MNSDKNHFFIKNDYPEDIFSEIDLSFKEAANRFCYPLGQSTIEKTPINYLPLSVDRAFFQNVKEDLKNVYSAIIKLITEYQRLGILQEKLALSDVEYQLFKNENYDAISGVLRFDLLYSPKGFKIVEIDADPDALFLHDVSFNTLSAYFPKNYSVSYQNHYDLYLRLMNELGIKAGDKGLILMDPNLVFTEEYELNKRILGAFGYDIKQLPYSDFLDMETYDFIKRAYEFHRMLNADAKKLLTHLSVHNTVNKLSFRLMGYKNLFMWLHNECGSDLFSGIEQSAIARIIPETKIYNDIEQKDYIIANREHLVLKPILGAEGEDVYVGNILTQAEWIALFNIKVKADGAWLYQELVETAKVSYYDQHSSEQRMRYFDFSPHMFVFKNECVFGKNLVRYSDKKILNVAQGGTFGYGIEI